MELVVLTVVISPLFSLLLVFISSLVVLLLPSGVPVWACSRPAATLKEWYSYHKSTQVFPARMPNAAKKGSNTWNNSPLGSK
jgi:hypothetical protein